MHDSFLSFFPLNPDFLQVHLGRERALMLNGRLFCVLKTAGSLRSPESKCLSLCADQNASKGAGNRIPGAGI